MLKAVKGNKAYKIDEKTKERYLAEGFDIVEDGKVVERSPQTTVPYADYAALEAKLKAAEEQLAAKAKTSKKSGTEGTAE